MEEYVSASAMTPRVSVCMLTYNQEAYVRRAIEGVLMQKTDFSFELVIGEDCSQDTTYSICMEYQQRYPQQIRLLHHEKNMGINDNFYATLRSARGEYIAFCEGDDYWIDHYKLQKQADLLNANPHIGCIYTNLHIRDQESGEMEFDVFTTAPERFPLHSDLKSFILRPKYFAPCTWMFRRKFLTHEFIVSNDATFVFFAHLLSNTQILYLNDTTAVYRRLPESASQSKDPKKFIKRIFGVYHTQCELARKYQYSSEFFRQISAFFYTDFLPLFLKLRERRLVAQGMAFLTGTSSTIWEVATYTYLGRKIIKYRYRLERRKLLKQQATSTL